MITLIGRCTVIYWQNSLLYRWQMILGCRRSSLYVRSCLRYRYGRPFNSLLKKVRTFPLLLRHRLLLCPCHILNMRMTLNFHNCVRINWAYFQINGNLVIRKHSFTSLVTRRRNALLGGTFRRRFNGSLRHRRVNGPCLQYNRLKLFYKEDRLNFT